MTRKTYTLIGAGIALAVFLAIALLPTLVYGGYAGVMLAAAAGGAPVHATAEARFVIAAGMVVAVLGVGGLFTVAGAAVGATVGALTGAAAADEARA